MGKTRKKKDAFDVEGFVKDINVDFKHSEWYPDIDFVKSLDMNVSDNRLFLKWVYLTKPTHCAVDEETRAFIAKILNRDDYVADAMLQVD